MDGGGQRFMNTVFAGGIQHAEIISVPDRMVGLSKSHRSHAPYKPGLSVSLERLSLQAFFDVLVSSRYRHSNISVSSLSLDSNVSVSSRSLYITESLN